MQESASRTTWTPAHYIDGLRVLDERGQVRDLALLAVRLDAPELLDPSAEVVVEAGRTATHPNVVVSACGCQAALGVGFKVSRVYRGILVVPGHQQRSSLHGGSGYAAHGPDLCRERGRTAGGGRLAGGRGREVQGACSPTVSDYGGEVVVLLGRAGPVGGGHGQGQGQSMAVCPRRDGGGEAGRGSSVFFITVPVQISRGRSVG